MGKVILTSSHLPLPLPSPPLRRVPIRISLSSRSRRARPSPHQPSPPSPGTYLSVPQVECLLSLSPSDGNGMMVPFRSENRHIPVVRIARSGEYEFGWLEGESDIAPRPETHPAVKNLSIAIAFPRAHSNRSPQIALEMTCPILCQFE